LGCQKESNGDGGLFAHNVTPIFEDDTAAELVKAPMKFGDQMLFAFVWWPTKRQHS
jgi:hypothetical protein